MSFTLLSLFFITMIGYLTIFLRLDILVVSDEVDRLTLWCFNKILGYFYIYGSSGHGDAVNISSSEAELDDINFSRLPLIFTMCRIFFPHFKE